MRMLVPLMALAVAFFACSPTKKTASPDGPLEQLEFNVDSTKLGETIEVGGIRVSVPKNWEEVDSSTFRTITEVAARDTSDLSLTPTHVYKKSGGGSMLMVSTFARRVELGPQFIPWAGEVARIYRAQRPENEFKEAWLNLGGVEALQIMGSGDKLVHLKILLHGDQPVSLDYTVARADWAAEARTVESSLGSIRKIYP